MIAAIPIHTANKAVVARLRRSPTNVGPPGTLATIFASPSPACMGRYPVPRVTVGRTALKICNQVRIGITSVPGILLAAGFLDDLDLLPADVLLDDLYLLDDPLADPDLLFDHGSLLDHDFFLHHGNHDLLF